MDNQRALNRAQGFVMIARPRVYPFQVLQHPRQDLFLRHGKKKGGLNLHLAAVHFFDHSAAFLFGQQPPAVEWVNQYLVFIPDKFDDEMAGHSDTEKLQPDPSRDLEEKNRERDRDS